MPRACVVCGCEVSEAGQGGATRRVCSAHCGERRTRDYQSRYYREVTKPARAAVRVALRELRALARAAEARDAQKGERA